MQKYAVIGYPLTHSLSPQIHNFAFDKLKIDAVYEKIEILPNEFDNKFTQLKKAGYSGFNVTIPHKRSVMSFLGKIDTDAAMIGAVNTIIKEENRWLGYNTDVRGFLLPLNELKERFQHCLVLGTGGAARAVIFALAKYRNPLSITVAGRNLEKAAGLKQEFKRNFNHVDIRHRIFNNLDSILNKFSLVINTTPLGTFPDVDQTPISNLAHLQNNAIVYDLVYNPQKTRFLKDAQKAGSNIKTINGMDMLIQQAAQAFKLWTNHEMPINEVRNYLLNILKPPPPHLANPSPASAQKP
jgi:shikimate dehydrogenase